MQTSCQPGIGQNWLNVVSTNVLDAIHCPFAGQRNVCRLSNRDRFVNELFFRVKKKAIPGSLRFPLLNNLAYFICILYNFYRETFICIVSRFYQAVVFPLDIFCLEISIELHLN